MMLQTAPTLLSESGGKITNANAAAYQLMHTATLLALGRNVVGLEVDRTVLLFKKPDEIKEKKKDSALEYGRRVDIITQEASNDEVWHEVKSWKSKKEGDVQTDKPYTIKLWTWAKGPTKNTDNSENDAQKRGKTAHHQLSLDRIAAGIGVFEKSRLPKDEINLKVKSYEWQFHNFKTYSQAKADKGKKKLLAQSAKLNLIVNELKKDPLGIKPPKIFKNHYISPADPSGQIKEGALGALLNEIKARLTDDELLESINAELAELDQLEDLIK